MSDEKQTDVQSNEQLTTNENDQYTVVDEPVRDGLDNAVENSQVRSTDE